jgi:ABC transporter
MHLKPVLMNPCPLRYDRVGQMSGGERRRLQLLQVLARAPNVLLLDEPSKSSLRSSLVFSSLVVSRSFYLPPLCSLSLYLFPFLSSCLLTFHLRFISSLPHPSLSHNPLCSLLLSYTFLQNPFIFYPIPSNSLSSLAL